MGQQTGQWAKPVLANVPGADVHHIVPADSADQMTRRQTEITLRMMLFIKRL